MSSVGERESHSPSVSRHGLRSTPPTDSEQGPRKRMRKGTHSCLECRRRKIRCVFTPDARVCNECTARGISCTEQKYGDAKRHAIDKRKTLRQRAGELEGMITSVLQKLDAKADNSKLDDTEMNAAEALQSLRTELLGNLGSPASESADLPTTSAHRFNAPLLSLFDNAVISHKDEEGGEEALPGAGSKPRQPLAQGDRRMLRALRALMPGNNDLTAILNLSRSHWNMWNHCFPEYLGVKAVSLEEDQIEPLRNHICQVVNSDHVGLVCKVWLCLALCIQQIPSDFDFANMNLPAPPDALQTHYMSAVESLISSDESFAGTIDGMECMMLQGRFYINLGKPHRAWLVFRRASGFAHLLGLYRVKGKAEDAMVQRKQACWLQIWQADRFLSLLLGLPYASNDCHIDPKLMETDFASTHADGLLGHQFMLRLGFATGHIIDRNQDLSNSTLVVTMAIDQEIEEERKRMPASWWAATATADMSVEAVYDMFLAKFWFHNLRTLLHLPFMLKSPTDRRFEYSRIATLDSAREMIGYYRVLRDESKPALVVCNLLDFQAFTAAMVLVLDMLGFAQSSFYHDPTQTERDWDLVEAISSVLNREARRNRCSVAQQGARVLEDFLQVRHNPCQACEGDTYEAVIPYFGKIRIGAGKSFNSNLIHQAPPSSINTPQLNGQLHTPPESEAARMSSRSGASLSTSQPSTTPASTHTPHTTTTGSSTPPHSVEIHGDPLVALNNYFQPLTGGAGEAQHPWQDLPTDWTSMVNLDLREDWSWFLTAGSDSNGSGQASGPGNEHTNAYANANVSLSPNANPIAAPNVAGAAMGDTGTG
ncbi:MAG: hypothetical protein M1838_005903 [Thelocarpon superellum]|nr:MAG: hypothetical protein M1838_005903 [Thelocarpon superellum]